MYKHGTENLFSKMNEKLQNLEFMQNIFDSIFIVYRRIKRIKETATNLLTLNYFKQISVKQ